MLKVSLLEFLLRGIPEEFLFIFAAYTFSKTSINMKKYLVSSSIFVAIATMIRWLPIVYGVHTLLNLIVLIIIMVVINKVEIVKSIRASIVSIIIAFMCEGANVFIIQSVLHKDMNQIFKDPTLKSIYGIPSLIIFGIIIALFYLRLSKRKELRNISNGEIYK